MRLTHLIMLSGALLVAFGCGKAKETQPAPAATQAAAPAVVPPLKDSVVTSEPLPGSPEGSYAYYLPATAPAQGCPVLICFDSHARGKDPVKKYRTLADRHGWLLVGSNVSKNGQHPSEGPQHYDRLRAALDQKFKLDPAQVYVTGFSGGARVAASVAQTRTGVAGVIGCAAGFQPQQGDRWPYYGIVGVEDFNFWEMDQLDHILDQAGQTHVVHWWAGGHAWPPVEVMDGAMAFMTLRHLRADDPRRDSLVADCRQRYDRADPALAGHDTQHGRYRLARAKAATLEGLDGPRHSTGLPDDTPLLPDPAAAEQALAALQTSELAERNNLVAQIGTRSAAEWQTLADKLRAGRHPYAGRNHASDMRILNFLSLNVYFQCDGALKAGDLAAAEHFIPIYAAVDPQNAEHAYMTAILRLRQGRRDEAMAALTQAAELGFKEPERPVLDPTFDPLRNEPSYQAALRKMQE